MWDQVDALLNKMAPITLKQMNEISLMDRLDYKFAAPVALLPDILLEVADNYMVQEVDNKRISPYITQYLDTSDMGFYLMHLHGKLNRQKIRIRSYVASNLSFLEVKNKNNKGRTIKLRIPYHTQRVNSIEDINQGKEFLTHHSLLDVSMLIPSLENSFNRITLVNNEKTERITIDFNICFKNFKTQKEERLDRLMILELKQNGWTHSHFRDILTQMKIKRSSLSKYCLGIVLTDPNVKYNRFKRKLISLNTILNQST